MENELKCSERSTSIDDVELYVGHKATRAAFLVC